MGCKTSNYSPSMRKVILAFLSVIVIFYADIVKAQQSEVKASVSPIGSYVMINIKNCSSTPLISLDITVTGENLRIYSNGDEEWVPVTFFKGTKYFDTPIQPNSTNQFKSDEIRKDMNFTSRLRNVTITTGNPTFQKIEF